MRMKMGENIREREVCSALFLREYSGFLHDNRTFCIGKCCVKGVEAIRSETDAKKR